MLLLTGSVWSATMLAEFVATPMLIAFTTSVIVDVAPDARLPRLHVTVAPFTEQFADGDTETNCSRFGIGIVTIVFVAVDGPRFFATIVNVSEV